MGLWLRRGRADSLDDLADWTSDWDGASEVAVLLVALIEDMIDFLECASAGMIFLLGGLTISRCGLSISLYTHQTSIGCLFSLHRQQDTIGMSHPFMTEETRFCSIGDDGTLRMQQPTIFLCLDILIF